MWLKKYPRVVVKRNTEIEEVDAFLLGSRYEQRARTLA